MTLNPVVFAMRRPVTVMVIIAAVVLSSLAALGELLPEKIEIGGLKIPVRSLLPMRGMSADIFPDMGVPVIYVAQPYGGMDPAQMEGLLTNFYEYHFLYITGIEHVESRNVQGVALMKLFFHPGTDMAQAMAETIGYVNRSRAFMPVGTVPPFITRYDAGSLPVGYLVVSGENRTLGELQTLALFNVRPIFAGLPGVSAPPPFGGNQRTLVIHVNPDKLKSYGMSPDEIVAALATGNTIAPSGNLTVGDLFPMVPSNSVVRQPSELEEIAIRPGRPPVVIGDVGKVHDTTDIPSGYALLNGKRTIYLLVTKRADASTLSVVEAVKANLARMQAVVPEDVKLSFEFDQTPQVTRALSTLAFEAGLGALLTGLTVLIFLRDWRSAVVVVLNIPFALLAACTALWLTRQSVNIMTLGGLALAVGVLVDEAVVAVENMHARMDEVDTVPEAIRIGNALTAGPRLLAMLCILAVFLPAFFMAGVARALFAPLALAVGFSMIASYLLSSTFVPIASHWLLKKKPHGSAVGLFDRLRRGYAVVVRGAVRLRWLLVPAYLAASLAVIVVFGRRLGLEIFPAADGGQFQLRLRAADGTGVARTEQMLKDVLGEIRAEVGPDNLSASIAYVGAIPSTYPINAVYQWMRGQEEAVVRVALRPGCGIAVEPLKERLRTRLSAVFPEARFSFEAGDIISEVLSFGSPTPVEIAVSGPNPADNRRHAEALRDALAKIPSLRDLQFAQSLDYPVLAVEIDRRKAGGAGVTVSDVARSVTAATSSSRFTAQNFWPDPKTGVGFQIQVEIPQTRARAGDDRTSLLGSIEEMKSIPIKRTVEGDVRLRDVARVNPGTAAGQYDRYNMRRMVTITANVSGEDLGAAAARLADTLRAAGEPPRGVNVDVRGQIKSMRELLGSLGIGLGVTVIAVLLLLTANFQSLRLSLTAAATLPGVIAGVVLALTVSGMTMNVQSFIGAIMAVGVATANAILLVTFAEHARIGGRPADDAAVEGGCGRLRAVLMTGIAMMAGMAPMALATGEGGHQTAPLARAVIGGLAVSVLATLFVLPAVFTVLMGRASSDSPSFDPGDPDSRHYRTNFDQTMAAAQHGKLGADTTPV